jgi:hypothetical protein
MVFVGYLGFFPFFFRLEYRHHIAGSTVFNSKNLCQNNLEIIDLKSWIKGKSSNINFQNFYTIKVLKAIPFIKFIRRNMF